MSWDNVKGVSAAKIWIDNPDMTQAYLFANGNHQVKLTVGVSFTLADTAQPGPTEDEVQAALGLIDFETGAGLSHLKAGNKGQYTYVYQPNMPAAIKVIEASEEIAYQYELDYYLSSDSSINANYASEKVALFLSYTNASGTKVDYSTASGSKSQSYVAVTVYSPKRYSMPGSEITPIILYEQDDKPHYVKDDYGMVTTDNVFSIVLYALRIDDPYFIITHFETLDTVLSPNAFRQIIINGSAPGQTYEYHLVQGYLPSQNNVRQKNYSYTTELSITVHMSSGSTAAIANYNVDVYQMPGEIIFPNIEVEIDWNEANGAGDLVKSSASAKFTVFDQFGNQANVEVGAGNDHALTLSNVT